ncbi:heme o synthase [Alkalicoccobacillus porphyridii]|uniref:Protoheme IX farnesyltransferase n=1 Tax=Alkalicoccobacillus porphyridii TaxID=2597270 RepID=A0A554A397_9BACI|nr:heme o synthase [Alkalicoccobacillus porphyridii]TSB48158.1 protoheme IX farnesyltransferase [Alkalicoccobacillus porphyridii]
MKSVKLEKTVEQTQTTSVSNVSYYADILFETIKTGIIKSNVLAMFAGLCFALFIHGGSLFNHMGAIILALVGSSLVIGAAGTFNNLYDRDIDAKMERTKKRPTVTGSMTLKNGLILGILFSITGIILLAFASPLAALLGFLGLFLYTVPYTIWTKRSTIYNTEVGSLSGAVPPLIGWAAISPDIYHPAAIGLFVLMLIWQMPHFYAIAIRKLDDYRAAGVPMLPVIKGIRRTKIQTLVYLVILLASSVLFFPFSKTIAITSFVLTLGWMILGIAGYKRMSDYKWATAMFIYSLNHITILFALIIGYSLILMYIK